MMIAMKQVRRANRHSGSGRFNHGKRRMVVDHSVGQQDFLAAPAPHVQRRKIIESPRGADSRKQPIILLIPKPMSANGAFFDLLVRGLHRLWLLLRLRFRRRRNRQALLAVLRKSRRGAQRHRRNRDAQDSQGPTLQVRAPGSTNFWRGGSRPAPPCSRAICGTSHRVSILRLTRKFSIPSERQFPSCGLVDCSGLSLRPSLPF